MTTDTLTVREEGSYCDCPNCGSSDDVDCEKLLEHGDESPPVALHPLECTACGTRWVNLYKLHSSFVMNEGTP